MATTARRIAELGGNPNGTWSIFGLDNNREAEIHIAAGALEGGRGRVRVKVKRLGGAEATGAEPGVLERTAREAPA